MYSDDILGLVIPVVSHRIILSAEARLAQTKVDKVLKDIISKIPVPVLIEKAENMIISRISLFYL